nr:hypothetical protein [Acinetobacter sp. Marseille-Q1620]
MRNNKIKMGIIMCGIWALSACDQKTQSPVDQTTQAKTQQSAEVLPYLNIQENKAQYALPFCEKKNCIDIDIQTINTQDQWINDWVSKNQANVIQNQINLKQNLSLQEAINAYVKKSDEWQKLFNKNKPYELALTTKVVSARNQFVLLQISVNSKQEDVTVKDRQYFFVADRRLKKGLGILDVIQTDKQTQMNEIIQENYKKWLKEQGAESRKNAPKKLFWGQAEWFFDTEGVGLHFRPNDIVKDGTQLDIYLSKAETQRVLKPEIFQKMF